MELEKTNANNKRMGIQKKYIFVLKKKYDSHVVALRLNLSEMLMPVYLHVHSDNASWYFSAIQCYPNITQACLPYLQYFNK